MTTRAVGATASIDWLRRALNLGRDNPKAIFGGALLLLAAILALAAAMVVVLVAVGMAAKPDGLVASGASMLVGLVVTALMAALIAGYLRLVDAVEHGRGASAGDVFSVLAEPPVAARAVLFMLVLILAQNLLLAALVGLLAPDIGSWYLHTLQGPAGGTPPTALPDGFSLAMLVMWVVGLLFYGVQAVGFGQIALRGSRVGAALADGVRGTLRNLPALLLLFVLAVLAAIALAIVLVLVMLLAGVLAKLVGGWVVAAIAVPLYLAFVVGLMVVMFGVMYFAWRDISGDGGDGLPAREDRIEL
ncbi:MAG: hypothetical protein ACK4MU_02775 [Thermomonas sp.]